MKKNLIILILTLSFALFSYGVEYFEYDPYEIDFEDYMIDTAKVESLVNKNRKIEKFGASDVIKKDKTQYNMGDMSLNFSDSKSTDKYLRGGIEQKQSASITKKRFELSGGIYNSYNDANLKNGTNELFFSPSIKVGRHTKLELNNALDAKGEYFTQELGVKYAPSFLKNGTIGVFGGTKFNKDSTRSEKIKFSTDFYLF